MAYFSALLDELQATGGEAGGSSENDRRAEELRRAIEGADIKGAEARANEKAREIERWGGL